MSAFITIADYDSSIHSEILNAITRNDAAIIEIAEDHAIAEMKGYLTARYDVNQIFNKTGEARDPLILMFAIDITLYHLHTAHNPQKMTQIRIDRYERVIQWLKDVQRGNINPTGLPLLTPTVSNSYIQVKSNPKRSNHF